ncbi:MAG TPA: class I SAM-dependent methyltransferase [Actinomycetota bacterium]|jgi:SAM-dependent methyltransferase|nr:class I SAM-dependent methyltransferase [Actinomycetota bacterium]
MAGDDRFEQLVAEAEAQAFEGWDFSLMDGRSEVDPYPWDYAARVAELAADADAIVDLGTGGGEFVAALPHRARLTVATEGWMPNVSVAGRALRPLGVHVVAYEGASDNAAQRFMDVDGPLPFRDATFDLVFDRHEAFRASEVARVLRPGGTFLTQQTGSLNEIEINRMLGDVEPSLSPTLDEYVAQLERAGLRVTDAREGFPVQRFFDVGAVVYKLRAIPWQYEGFDVGKHRDGLRRIHHHIAEHGSFAARHHRFLLEATKP